MTRIEALKAAESLLTSASKIAYDGYSDPSKAKALIARAKVEAAKAYIELARELHDDKV